jgi:hypothetical protein
MAWGYNQSNGLFTGYNARTYSEDAEDARDAKRGSGPLMTNNDWTWAYGSPTDQKRQAQNKSGASRGGSSRGGGGGSSSRSTVQRLRFMGDAPELPDLPKLEMPKVDKRAVRALTQKIAAPSIRKLQEGVQQAMNVHTDNPNVRRMTLREALQGYGSGLETTMAGAGSQARQEHQQELNLLANEARANWQTSTEALMAEYQNAYNKYMQSAEKITETNEGAGGADVPMVVRRNIWGTPEIGPAFQAGYNMKLGRDPLYGY